MQVGDPELVSGHRCFDLNFFTRKEKKQLSSLKVHTVQSITTSAALYPFIGENVVPFGLAVIFIDLDHLIEYVRDTRCLDVLGVFSYYDIIIKNIDRNYLALSVFHTIEFFVLVFCLSTLFPVLTYVFFGMLWHMALDLFYIIKARKPFIRAYSLIEYFVRSKSGKYVTSVLQILKMDGINTSGISNLSGWMKKWGA